MKVVSLTPGLLLITKGSFPENPSCLSQNFYGYSGTGRHGFYKTTPYCLEKVQSFLDAGHIVSLDTADNQTQLVWFERPVVDACLLASYPTSLRADMNTLGEVTLSTNRASVGTQHLMFEPTSALEILYEDTESALARMDRKLAPHVDSFTSGLWRTTILPDTPAQLVPVVPPPAVQRVKDLLSRVRFDPVIASAVNNISVPQMRNDIRFLTGEDAKSPIISRHSFSDGVLVAADWLKDRFEETGAKCALKPFLDGFAPNVIWSVAI